jgi:hypothetical protein
MVRFSELIKPNSGKSSTRYVGIVSLYALMALGVVVLVFSCFKEIPHNNSVILESIAYTLGAVVVGVFAKTAFEKKSDKNIEL